MIAECHRPIREGHTGVKCTNRFNILLNDTGDIDNDPNASDDAIRGRANNLSRVSNYDACELPASSLSTVWRNNPASKARSEMLSSDNDVTIDLDSLTKSIMKPGLKIGCLNIRGLLGKIDELRTILKKCQFDLMCVCETFIDYNVAPDEIIIQGYSVELRNRNRHGGGVLIYVKDGIKYTKITDLTSTLVESTWINIKQLAVGVMYRPPSSNVEYFTNMLDQLDHIYSKYDNVILLGDLNYDCVSGVRIVTNPLCQIETLYNMRQLVKVATRVTISTSTLLDVIFSTNHESHTVTGVYKTGMSDHYMIYTVYDNAYTDHGHHDKVLTFRNYKKFSTEFFIKDLLALDCLHDTNWSSNLLMQKWDEFKNAFINISNIHAPFHCRRLKNRVNPWFDSAILQMIYRRDYLKRKAVSSKEDRLWQSYKSLRNKITYTIRLKKANYYGDKITENQSNPKQLWKVISQLTGTSHNNDTPSDLNANDFNNYFSNIGSDTVSHLRFCDNGSDVENELFWRGSNCLSKFEFSIIKEDC